jgi:hypothetical protein
MKGWQVREDLGRVAVGVSTILGIIIIILAAVPLVVGAAMDELRPLGLEPAFLGDVIRWTTVAIIASRSLQAMADKVAQALAVRPVGPGDGEGIVPPAPVQPDPLEEDEVEGGVEPGDVSR